VRQTVPIEPFQKAPAFQPLGGIAGDWRINLGGVFQRPQEKLNISWDNGPPTKPTTRTAYKNELRETSHNPCKVVRNIGDADAVLPKGGQGT